MLCSLLFASWLCFQPAPVVCEPKVYDKKAIFTAYTLSVSETDGDPEIGAGNHYLPEYIKRGIRPCATRRLPLHTIIEVEGYGRYEVLDRTSKEYSDRIDLLYKTKTEALQFGKRELKWRVVK